MHHCITRRGWILAVASAAAAPSVLADPPPFEVAMRPMRRTSAHSLQFRSNLLPEQPAVVTAVALDPLGRFVAIACDDCLIRIVAADSLRPLALLKAHRDLVRTLDFAPSGKLLISAGNDGKLSIWRSGEWGNPERTCEVSPAIACARFSPDSREVAAVGFTDEVLFIDVATAKVTSRPCDCADLRSIAYRSDASMLVVLGRNGHAHLYDASSREPLSEHRLHNGRVRDACFLADDRTLVSVGEDGLIAMFDTAERKVGPSIQITPGRLFALARLDDRHVAVAGSDNALRIVDVAVARVVDEYFGHQGSVATLAARGGWLYSGGFDATLRRWPIHRLQGNEERIADGDDRLER